MSTWPAAVVNGFIVSIPLTATVWLALRLTPRVLNAATKYVIWWLALLFSLSLPLFFVPSESRSALLSSRAAAGTDIRAGTKSVPQPAMIQQLGRPLGSRTVPKKAMRVSVLPIAIATGPWTAWLTVLWLIGTLLMVGRLVVSVVALRIQRSRATDAPAFLVGLLNQSLARCGAKRQARIAMVDRGASPMVSGPFRPSILFPARLIEELEQAELEQICLHEAAHLARFDDCSLLLQRCIEALFVVNPVVRFIGRQLDLEREIACDDYVLAATGQTRPYASCLAHVAELANGSTGSHVAAAAADESSHLFRRIDMILDNTRLTGTRVLKARFAGGVLALVALTWLAGKSPALLAFANPVPQMPRPAVQSRPISFQTDTPAPVAVRVAQAGQPLTRQSPAVSAPVTRTEVVRIPVTVTDPMNRFVTGLDRDSFRIYEDGVEQQISSLNYGGARIALRIVSNQVGIEKSIDQAIALQRLTLSTLRDTYKDSHPEIVAAQNRLQQLLAEKDSVASMMSLSGVQFNDPAGLLASLHAAVGAAANDPPATRGILIIFDPRDTSFSWPENELHELIRTAGMPIYTVAVRNPPDLTMPHIPEAEPNAVLNLLTSATGGRGFIIDTWLDLPGIQRKISIELQNQYSLSYEAKHPGPGGIYHRVEVRLVVPTGLPELKAHSLPGYYDSSLK